MSSRPANKQPRRWRRVLFGLLAGMVVIAVVGWFVVTSEPFLKSVVLPRVGTLIHGNLTTESIALNPFSHLELQGARLTDGAGEELFRIGALQARFKLLQLLDGVIALDDVHIEAPEISLREDAEGGSNLSRWMAGFSGPSNANTESRPAGKPVRFDVGKIDVTKGRFEFVRIDSTNKTVRAVVDGLDMSVDQLRNGQSSAAALRLNLLLEQSGADPVGRDSLKARLETSTTVALNEDLVPGAIESEVRGTVDEVLGRFAQSRGASARMTIASAGSKIENLTVVFAREGSEVGRVEVAGEFEVDPGVGEFDVTVHRLPPLVRDLASIALGVDFTVGSLDSTNHVVWNGLNKPVAARGVVQLGQLAVRDSMGSTPEVDLALGYDIHVDPEQGRGRFDQLNLSIREGGRTRASASISEPFGFGWAEAFGSEQGSNLEVSLTDVDLDDWQALTGKLPVAGLLNVSAAVQSQREGQMLAVDGRTSLRRGRIENGTNAFTNLDADLTVDGRLDRLHLLSVRSIDFTLSQSNRPPVSVRGQGTLNFTNLATDVQASLILPLTNVIYGVPGFPDRLGSGHASYDGQVVYTNGLLAVDGRLAGSNLDLSMVGSSFGRTMLDVPVSARLVNQRFTWSITNASIRPADGEVLPFSSSGDLGVVELAGTLSLDLPSIGTDLMNGYLTNHLDGQKLGSGLMGIMVAGELQSDGEQKWTAGIASTNMVVVGSDNKQIGPTFGDHLDVETLIHPGNKQFELRTCRGSIFADGKVAGRINATGGVRVNTREATLKIELRDLDEHALRPFASRLIGDHELENVEVTADLDLDYHPDESSGLKVSFSINDLLVREPGGRVAFDRQHLELLFDSQIVSNRMEVTQGQLRLAPTTNASNVINLEGWLDFENPNAMEGDIALRSPGFDLTAVYDLLSRPAVEVDPGSALRRERLKLARLQSETRETVLPFKRLQLKLDFRKLFLRELVASNWVARAIVRTNSVEMAPFSLSLNGAPINLATTITSHPDDAEFKLAVELEGVELAPVIRTFDPTWNHLTQAQLFGAADLHGRAAYGSSVWSSTSGHVYAGLTNAHAELLSREWQRLLQPVALLLQSPSLFSSPIDWFYSHTELGEDTLTIHQYTIVSEAYVADVHAVIPINTDFVKTVFPNVPIDLYLSRNLVTRLKLLAHEDDSEDPTDYVALPEFLYIRGTFDKPDVLIDKLKTSGMVIGKAGDFVGGGAGDLLKGVGNVTEDVGGWLSGRKIVGSNSKLGPVSHGIDFLFRSVGGIIGKTGGALESGAGVLTGTKVISGDVMAQRFKSFEWPRQFTNSPNVTPVSPK